MAWRFPLSTSTTNTVAVTLNLDEDLFVAKGVLIASQSNNAIRGPGSNHDVIIGGVAAAGGAEPTIFLGGNFSADQHNTLTVDVGGEVRSFADNAVELLGFTDTVTNNGLITGQLAAIFLKGVNAAASNTIVNNGTMTSATKGIVTDTIHTAITNFTNKGTLTAPTAYDAGTANAVDHVTNNGTINGIIHLGAGIDSYNGTSGHITGQVFGDAGNDALTGGAGVETFDGGTQNDTLIGNAGNDVLKGGANQDQLYGGLGNDSLTGGTELDYFVFNTTPNATTNLDTVADFVHGGDKFWMENSVFTTLGAAGALNPNFFKLGAAATDADDHIVYNNLTGALFYDSNGNAAGGSTQFATLTTKPILSAGDFVVI
jgi:Ca2+-binding RTX toxin-like protein